MAKSFYHLVGFNLAKQIKSYHAINQEANHAGDYKNIQYI